MVIRSLSLAHGPQRWPNITKTDLSERFRIFSLYHPFEDLEIAKRTLKFNQAWLAENHPSEPDMAEAMGLYTSLTEETALGLRKSCAFAVVFSGVNKRSSRRTRIFGVLFV